jgi:capsular polysaccharide export protein
MTDRDQERGPPPDATLAAATRGLRAIPHLAAFLDARRIVPMRDVARSEGVIGWGTKDRARAAKATAARHGLPFWHLEDGFFRSVGLGKEGAPPVSMVVDDLSIYYEAATPSRLERLIAEGADDASRARARDVAEMIVRERLTKYNAALDRPLDLGGSDRRPRILLVDQVRGDRSIGGSFADAGTFAGMLRVARRENPRARILVRLHPDVVAGHAQGYLSAHVEQDGFEFLPDDVNAHAVLDAVDEVWTVSSQTGFEALLRGLPVTCFGVPFYAGFGLTTDRVERPDARAVLARRAAAGPRTLDDLVAASLLRYARYADPVHVRPLDAMEALERLVAWRRLYAERPARSLCYRFQTWKRPVARAFLGGPFSTVEFGRAPPRGDETDRDATLVIWGMRDRPGFETAARALGYPVLRMEDGFLRSVGLGSDFILPASVCLDDRGLYFDARRPSRFEALAEAALFDPALVARAAALRRRLVAGGVTKYNLGGTLPSDLAERAGGRPILLVPGQVESDASIAYGSGTVRTNLDLLRAVREAHPEAFVVYKEHPELTSGNRRGRMNRDEASALADLFVAEGDIRAWFAVAAAVHVNTSLAGFEALIREKPVTAWGQPFFAGWGLTEDRAPIPRRTARLSLDELVAAALILYPRYIDPVTRLPCEVEDVLDLLEARRRAAAPPDVRGSVFRTLRRALAYGAAQARGLWSS